LWLVQTTESKNKKMQVLKARVQEKFKGNASDELRDRLESWVCIGLHCVGDIAIG
jgi:hypothetical protein